MTDLTARAVERLSKLLDRPITMAVPQVYYDLICDPWHLFEADIQTVLTAHREAAPPRPPVFGDLELAEEHVERLLDIARRWSALDAFTPSPDGNPTGRHAQLLDDTRAAIEKAQEWL